MHIRHPHTRNVDPARFLRPMRLVSHLDQVIRQLLDRVGRRARLHGLGVVCHEHGLRGLDDDDAFPAL